MGSQFNRGVKILSVGGVVIQWPPVSGGRNSIWKIRWILIAARWINTPRVEIQWGQNSILHRPSTVYMLPLLMCTRISLVPLSWYCSAVNWNAVRHNNAIIATYHRSVKKWNVCIALELIIFPVQLGCHRDGSRCKVFCLCNNECHFVSGISQSNFCIFHNTTESVIIVYVKYHIKNYKYFHSLYIILVSSFPLKFCIALNLIKIAFRSVNDTTRNDHLR